jgi:hypothetical protein
MKYLCLVYGDENALESVPDSECLAYDAALRQSGHCLASEALQPVHTATTVRVRSGRLSVTDGPFAETKEQLAGFYLVEARDLNEAIQLAAKSPPARLGSIEVRPIREMAQSEPPQRMR